MWFCGFPVTLRPTFHDFNLDTLIYTPVREKQIRLVFFFQVSLFQIAFAAPLHFIVPF